MSRIRYPFITVVLLGLVLAGCGTAPAGQQSAAGVRLVTTTNIIGDVVAQVAGRDVQLTVLMGPGVDPHTYVPTPRDVAAVHDAQLIFVNGAGLETFLAPLLKQAGGQARLVDLSQGLDLLPAGHVEAGEHAGEGEYDPHVWLSVPNVMRWVDAIAAALAEADPAHAEGYRSRAAAYRQELEALDVWIRQQVAGVPPERRKLVTNHPAFGYFAREYGFEQVGAVYPISPAAEPSAQDIAALEDAIRRLGVPAVFTETTVNPKLAEQVARDTGVRLVRLYTGSLGGPRSGAETYIEMMRYNTRAIVDALKGSE